MIALFKRHVPEARTYTFKDLKTRKLSQVTATPNHKFYVANKKVFESIQEVSPKDQLVSASGHQVQLVCAKNQNSHCGISYGVKGIPVAVYNLEVYRKHWYFVGKEKILVHNMYQPSEPSSSLMIDNDVFGGELEPSDADIEHFWANEPWGRNICQPSCNEFGCTPDGPCSSMPTLKTRWPQSVVPSFSSNESKARTTIGGTSFGPAAVLLCFVSPLESRTCWSPGAGFAVGCCDCRRVRFHLRLQLGNRRLATDV